MATTITGLGAYLPETVRTNDWWPTAIVASWRERLSFLQPGVEPDSNAPLHERLLAEGLLRDSADPFRGVRERRVLSGDERASTMELAAAREALIQAQISAEELDFVITGAFSPDYLGVSNASVLHHQLGCRSDCLSFTVDAAANAFLIQLHTARALHGSGLAGRGLLCQSNAVSALLPLEQPFSALFSDAATAQVVAPCDNGEGILAEIHRSDGARSDVLIMSVPGQQWYDEGRVVWYVTDPHRGREMLMSTVHRAQDVIARALDAAELTTNDIDFLASYQSTSWMTGAVQRAAGLEETKSAATHSWTGSVGACNTPFQLYNGHRLGILQRGDRVVAFSGGQGETWSAAVLRWTARNHDPARASPGASFKPRAP